MDEPPRKITLVNDENANECLYIDGKVWPYKGESTIFASELIYQTEGKPCVLEEVNLEHSVDEWPDKLEDALKAPGTTEA